MKILVAEMPKSGKECLFGVFVGMTSMYACMCQQRLYSRCKLDCGEKCPYLINSTTPTTIEYKPIFKELKGGE